MAVKTTKPNSGVSRPDGRKPLLVYLEPKLIQDLKVEALQRETYVYLIIEELLRSRKG